MIFDANNRKTISRRQLNLKLEATALSASVAGVSSEQSKLLEVDNANTVFYNFYDTQASSYENEARSIDGLIPSTYLYSDIDAAAQSPNQLPFFPPISYKQLIPLVGDGVAGRFHTTGSDSRFEINILSNSDYSKGLAQLFDLMENGITGSAASTTSVTLIPSGSFSSFDLTVTNASGFSAGNHILVYSGLYSGLYEILSILGNVLTIKSIVPSLFGINGSATVQNTYSAFTDAERQAMVHASYNEYLNNLGNTIITVANELLSKFTQQQAYLVSQNDTRTVQKLANQSEKAKVDNAITILNNWIALSFTGTNGKFVDANIYTPRNMVLARNSDRSARLNEIVLALGSSSSDSVIQSGEQYSTNVSDNSYFNRYLWLNVRINKATGSLTRYYASGGVANNMQLLLDQNLVLQDQYNGFFLTKKVILNDGTDILQLDSNSGLVIGDIVYAVSETQGELELGITEIQGTNQVKVDKILPVTYTTDDKARIFKLL